MLSTEILGHKCVHLSFKASSVNISQLLKQFIYNLQPEINNEHSSKITALVFVAFTQQQKKDKQLRRVSTLVFARDSYMLRVFVELQRVNNIRVVR